MDHDDITVVPPKFHTLSEPGVQPKITVSTPKLFVFTVERTVNYLNGKLFDIGYGKKQAILVPVIYPA
jgi:hypothetical protein